MKKRLTANTRYIEATRSMQNTHTVQTEATGPETNIKEYERNNPRPGSETVNTSNMVTTTKHRTGPQLNLYFMAAAY